MSSTKVVSEHICSSMIDRPIRLEDETPLVGLSGNVKDHTVKAQSLAVFDRSVAESNGTPIFRSGEPNVRVILERTVISGSQETTQTQCIETRKKIGGGRRHSAAWPR